jgi:hypothetical protein
MVEKYLKNKIYQRQAPVMRQQPPPPRVRPQSMSGPFPEVLRRRTSASSVVLLEADEGEEDDSVSTTGKCFATGTTGKCLINGLF